MNKKSKIYLVVLIWVAVLLQLAINNSINREAKMVEQVMSYGVDNLTEARVKAYAHYGNQNISTSGKEEIVKNLANKLGITSGYALEHKTVGDTKTTYLVKEGKQGNTTIKIITLNNVDGYNQSITENYIMVEILLKKSAGQEAYNYKNLLSDIYKDLGMTASTNIYLCNQTKGKLSDTELQAEITKFLTEMDAKEVETMEFDNVYTLYGYSRNIEEYVYQNDTPVNVNIAFTYDETEDITYIHKAVPFIDISF